MFTYEVMNESEALQERYQLLRDGEYDATIQKSEDRISATGNPMMDMTLEVYDDNGRSHSVRDFLVFTKNMMWKVIHCADSSGLLKEYEEKKLCSELIQGKRVKVKIITEAGSQIPQDKLKGKPVGSCYPDKNKVDDYIKQENKNNLSTNLPSTEDDPFGDTIPF